NSFARTGTGACGAAVATRRHNAGRRPAAGLNVRDTGSRVAAVARYVDAVDLLTNARVALRGAADQTAEAPSGKAGFHVVRCVASQPAAAPPALSALCDALHDVARQRVPAAQAAAVLAGAPGVRHAVPGAVLARALH